MKCTRGPVGKEWTRRLGVWEGFTITAILAARLLTLLSEPLLGGHLIPSGQGKRLGERIGGGGCWPWPSMWSIK